MNSLRKRAAIGGIIWAILSVLIGSFGIFSYIDSVSQSRFNKELVSRHVQLVVALGNNSGNLANIGWSIPDPEYSRPYSGQYWQIMGAGDQILASQSLVDTLLPVPSTNIVDQVFWAAPGPDGEPLRGIRQQISLDDGSVWTVMVAQDLTSLTIERKNIRKSLLLAFGLIAAIGIVGAILQIYVILHPLKKLRQEVSSRWDSQEGLQASEYPEEVAPLVTDINTLLDRNREIASRSRRQTADLAHALKTPSAIVRNELEGLRSKDAAVGAAVDALDRLDAQLMRSLARMRASGNMAAASTHTELDTSLSRLLRVFRALPSADGKVIEDNLAPNLSVRMDQQDFEEIIGNLLDNALKWCSSTVRISTRLVESDVVISITDDGPGIKDADKRIALVSGGRLDTASPGTGLGLAIASDLAQTYGGSLQLERSERLGGLSVNLRVPHIHLR